MIVGRSLSCGSIGSNGLDWIRLSHGSIHRITLDFDHTPMRLTANDPDRDFLAEILHERHHFRGDFTSREREGSIDIKEGKDTRLFGCGSRHDRERGEK
jgi:hypothetical protein